MTRRLTTLLAPLLVLLTIGLPANAAPDDERHLLIVHAAELDAAARDWSGYRAETGWTVHTVRVEPGPATTRRPEIVDEIRAWIDAAPDVPTDRRAILLLGDADESGVPTFHRPQKDPLLQSWDENDEYATDQPYQVVTGANGRTLIALGRVPARDDDEARGLLERIRTYEQSPPPGSWRRRITYVAGEGRFGPMDRVLESLFKAMIDTYIPAEWDVSVLYASAASTYCPPPSTLSDTVIERIGDGALLFNYIGHGHARGLDALYVGRRRYDMFSVHDVDRLPARHGQAPIALLTCCSTGYYDRKDRDPSLAEAMLFSPEGPIAVIAGSRITHPYANAVFQKDVTHALLNTEVATLGGMDRDATMSLRRIDPDDGMIDALAYPIALGMRWVPTLPELRAMHAEMYNLLGDPATRIPRPARDGIGIMLDGGVLTGRVAGLTTGTAEITIESARASCVDADALIDDNAGTLEQRTRHNFPRVSERVFRREHVSVVDHAFTLTLDRPLPPGAAWIKVYVHGTDDSGRPVEVMSALAIGPAATPASSN